MRSCKLTSVKPRKHAITLTVNRDRETSVNEVSVNTEIEVLIQEAIKQRDNRHVVGCQDHADPAAINTPRNR